LIAEVGKLFGRDLNNFKQYFLLVNYIMLKKVFFYVAYNLVPQIDGQRPFIFVLINGGSKDVFANLLKFLGRFTLMHSCKIHINAITNVSFANPLP
jgi:hypothetical protein